MASFYCFTLERDVMLSLCKYRRQNRVGGCESCEMWREWQRMSPDHQPKVEVKMDHKSYDGATVDRPDLEKRPWMYSKNRVCSTEGCGRRIKNANKTGLCQECYRKHGRLKFLKAASMKQHDPLPIMQHSFDYIDFEIPIETVKTTIDKAFRDAETLAKLRPLLAELGAVVKQIGEVLNG